MSCFSHLHLDGEAPERIVDAEHLKNVASFLTYQIVCKALLQTLHSNERRNETQFGIGLQSCAHTHHLLVEPGHRPKTVDRSDQSDWRLRAEQAGPSRKEISCRTHYRDTSIAWHRRCPASSSCGT